MKKNVYGNEVIMYRDWEIEVFGNNNKIFRVWNGANFRDFYDENGAETYIDYLIDTF